MRANDDKPGGVDWGTHAIIAGIVALFLFVAIGLPVLLSQLGAAYACRQRWAGSYETSYGYWSGCRVLVKGKLVPEGNVREF